MNSRLSACTPLLRLTTLQILGAVCFLVVSSEVNAQSENVPKSGESGQSVFNDGQNDSQSILGLYKTKNHKYYYEQYRTRQYSTIEFKENNRAELRVITDNTESDHRSKSDNCHVFEAVDYLEYNIVEDGTIEMTCLEKEEGWCGEKTTKGCFDYVLEATITEEGLQIKNNLFIRE